MNKDVKTQIFFMIAFFLTAMWFLNRLAPTPAPSEATGDGTPSGPFTTGVDTGAASSGGGAGSTSPGGAIEATDDAPALEYTVAVVRASNPGGTPAEQGYEATFSTRGAGLLRYRLLGYRRAAGQEGRPDSEVLLLDPLATDRPGLAIEQVSAAVPGVANSRQTARIRNAVYRLVRIPEHAVLRTPDGEIAELPDGVVREGHALVMRVHVPALGVDIERHYDFAPTLAPASASGESVGQAAASASPYTFTTSVRLVNRNDAGRRFQFGLAGPSGMLPDDRTRSLRQEFVVGKLKQPGGAAVSVTSKALQSMKEDETVTDGSARLAWVGYRNRFFATLLATADPESLPNGQAEFRLPTARMNPSSTLPEEIRTFLTTFYKEAKYAGGTIAAPDTAFNVWWDDKTVAPGASLDHAFLFYGGPMESNTLEQADPRFNGLVVYALGGWLDPLAWVFVKLLSGLYWIIGNYGVAMILVTIIVKTCMHPLTRKMYLSGQRMQLLQPLVKELRAKYGQDQQKLMQETAKLYKKHNVSMAGGCLPMLVQMPIFFALYGAFSQSFELRQAGFIPKWIVDLSVPDTVHTLSSSIPLLGSPEISVLPMLYLGLQILQMSLQPKSPDPAVRQQQAMMKFMPVVFMLFFYAMPSGLVLYFTASSLYSVIESLLIRRKYPPIIPGHTTLGVVDGEPVVAAEARGSAGVGMGAHQGRTEGKKKKKKNR